ncbi:site-specific integrase [uncultured Corynebacterium sp.]|uniref:tyrosine-type recombinase/integrase n=1 Tax=uncultured Corynebacterium sp. TaxID=159447 RepID=UPI0025FBD41A|nr:site-specific integrase [uncultured Corynebacterium sp.]
MPQKKTTAKGTIRWVGRFRPPGGKETSRSFDTRRDAKAWEDEQARNYRRGVWLDPSLDKLTVKEVYDRWADRPARENSKLVYAQVSKNLGPMGDIYARKLTRADVDTWYRVLISGRPWAGNEPLSPRVARSMVSHLSAAMTMAVDEEWVGRNPVRIPRLDHDDVVRVNDVPTGEDIESIVDLLRSGGAPYERKEKGKLVTVTSQPAPVVADMVLVAVGTGARISELCGLDVGDVYMLRREIDITSQAHHVTGERVSPKTRSSARVIPVGNDLLPVLDRLIDGRGTDEPLFATRNGVSYRAETAGKLLRRVAEDLGMEWRFHSFRHFYASRLIAGGLPVNQVQRLLGHADPSMTLRVYTHLWPDSDDVARRAIEGILGGDGIIAGSSVGRAALRSV